MAEAGEAVDYTSAVGLEETGGLPRGVPAAAHAEVVPLISLGGGWVGNGDVRVRNGAEREHLIHGIHRRLELGEESAAAAGPAQGAHYSNHAAGVTR